MSAMGINPVNSPVNPVYHNITVHLYSPLTSHIYFVRDIESWYVGVKCFILFRVLFLLSSLFCLFSSAYIPFLSSTTLLEVSELLHQQHLKAAGSSCFSTSKLLIWPATGCSLAWKLTDRALHLNPIALCLAQFANFLFNTEHSLSPAKRCIF